MIHPPPGGAGRAGVAGWVLFDVAAQPVFTLITTFIFAPYFAARVAATPVEGQALWGLATAIAGLAIALMSPVLGAIADASGRRKPWIAAFSVLLVAGCLLLWQAVPGGAHAVTFALAGLVLATLGAEFATVFTNAMMPTLAPPERLGRLSGIGWAAGYLGGLLTLAVMLALMTASPDSGLTLIGREPLFGLDPARGDGDRAAGPFSALWYLVFVLPLFLFTPDAPRRLGFGAAVCGGLGDLRRTLAALGGQRNIALYLLAHMLYADGLVALFAFGGIYAAGIFGWSTMEIGVFGILLTVAGTFGAAAGGFIDDRLGPKPVIMGALACLIAASVGILSTGPDHVLFAIDTAPAMPGDGLYASTAERAYLALGLVIGAVAGPLQSASRTLLVRLSPPDRITQFFGLYALSGKVTSFAGPALVGVATALTQSQRAGIAVLVVFFAAGVVLLTRVSGQRAAEV